MGDLKQGSATLSLTLPEMMISSMIFFAGYALNQTVFETITYYVEDKEKAIRYKYFYILTMISLILLILFNAKWISKVLSTYI